MGSSTTQLGTALTSPVLEPSVVHLPLANTSRAAWILRILSYNSAIHCIGFVVSNFSVLSTAAAFVHVEDEQPLELAALPILQRQVWRTALQCIIVLVITSGSISVLATLSPIQTAVPKQHPLLRRKWKTLYLCLVTKGINRQTVLRSVDEMRSLQALDPRVRFVVVTEQGRDFNAAALGVDIIFIPTAYQARVAKYKARALEYFRIYQNLSNDDWVLHLDEETSVDTHCLLTCVQFIENTRFEWGQGLIMYNTVNYWESALLTFAEALRFREDLGRFQVQHSRLHYTCWGCHGSFLLASGRVENAVTFETSCLAEDFWFADRACSMGFGGGWIPSIAREQCNFTVRDFLNQRRRWYCGMWQVGFWGKLMDITWVLSALEVPLVLLTWAGRVALPSWLVLWMHAYFSSNAFSGTTAMVLQDLDAGLTVWQILWHILMAPVLSVAVQCIQLAAILYGIFCPPAGFDIVEKK